MSRCVIVGGAPICNYAALRPLLKEDDFIIYCDCGLKHVQGLGRAPQMVIGDFDSHENPGLPVETIVLPHVKDDTDTFFAVKTAYGRGYRDFLLLGVFGGRMDHTLANLYMLLWLDNRACRALAADDYSDFEICSRGEVTVPSCYEYFSLLAIDSGASGITIKDALYSLDDGAIDSEFQLGVSNEPLPGRTARVTVKQGKLLVIKDRR